jgi:predicted amidohydrolase
MIAAVVQMTSGGDLARNLERAADWIARAAQAGAAFVALPENFALMQEEDAGPSPVAEGPDGPIIEFLRDQAKRHSILLAGGSLPERVPGDARCFNTAPLIDADGTVLARYRKIHLFDVDLPDASFKESRTVGPGEEIVVAETRVGPVGLSVCYDLRFPELYRALAERGARILLVPAAFTVPTGRDHWEVLLRARAIENQAFVLAAAQYGIHNATRRSFGRSMIINPWGVILATVPDGEGIALAELDFATLERIRRELPALRHRRLGV